MTPIAQARIVAWEGASLWVVDSTRLAQTGPRVTDDHAHHAIQLVIPLEGDFRLSTREASLAAGVATVAPDTPHSFQAEGRFALLFVEPKSRDGRIISEALFAEGALAQAPADLIGSSAGEILDAYLTQTGSRERLVEAGRRLVRRLAGDRLPPVLDYRVRKVIAWASQIGDQPASLTQAAPVVGLSPGRLSHLFTSQTGLSLRTYLLWLRLTRAVGGMSQGASLTQAAHEAGFADAAHFSRTFRRMFGVPAASLSMN